MKTVLRWGAIALIASTAWAQSPQTTTGSKAVTRRPKKASPAKPVATQEDVQVLKDALTQQQQQIQQLQDELRQRDQAWQDAQQKLQQLQTSTAETQSQVAKFQSTTDQQQDTVGKLKADVTDVQTTLTNTAIQTQDEQKRVSGLESVLGRFRWTGDVRVRQEDFFQDYGGCAACVWRPRERIRVRLGVEGKLSDDFIAGAFLATGAIFDPTSTNETLTNAFERKTISLDRGYITYQPKDHKWLQLTGGKFAFTWVRTPQTFDNDLNPEGFSEKVSYDVKGNEFLKNFTVTGMQLLFNEVSAPTASTNANCLATGFQFCGNGFNTNGADSFAVGGQVSAKLQLGKRVTMTPSYSVLNWRNENSLLNEPSTVTGTTGITVAPGASPTSLPVVSTSSGAFGPNGITNATVRVGTAPNGAPIVAFASRFLYGDAILDTTVDTGMPKLPWRVVLEYLQNMRAARTDPRFGRQSHMYKVETYVGQLKNKGDYQFGYGFWRQEQDSVLASFNESDQRAPTNVLQHWISAQYQYRNNITLSYTQWIGRTLNPSLQNARLAPGLTAGQSEPYLKRMQFDIVYKF